MTKQEIGIIVGGFIINALVFGGYLSLKLKLITAAEAFNIVLVSTLVLVTIAYVKRTADIAQATREQSNASVKMAEEMREQRYDTVRPVIDIQHADDGTRRLGELAASKDEIVSGGLTCILHNIGLGPAIDVYSFTPHNSGEYHRYDFGVLGIGKKGDPRILSVVLEANKNRLLACYKDAYGREIESSREVQEREGEVRKTGGTGWELGPLQITVIDKGDKNDS